MKNKIIIALIILTSFQLAVLAQTNQDQANNQGITFVKGQSWQQVLTEAKSRHKFIFVDCYATWCVPCKAMEKDVYLVDSVGSFMNANFICVKVQMDRTAKDNDTIKSGYSDAKMLETGYAITAYPTFLFFDENGTAVHRAEGGTDAAGFLQIARNALLQNKQYYTLLNAYNDHTLGYPLMPELAAQSMTMDKKDQGFAIAHDYMHGYLEPLDERAFLSQPNIDFIERYPQMLKPQDRLFQLCYQEGVKVDSALHDKDFAERTVNAVIYKEEIIPKLKAGWDKNAAPDWEKIGASISRQFGQSYVSGNLNQGKCVWYKHIKDGKDYAHYLVLITEPGFRKNGIRSPMEAGFYYNNRACDIFLYDDNKAELNMALAWMDAAIKVAGTNANLADSKASVLYKLGRKNEAVNLEAEAAKLDPKDKDIAETLKKMQTGQKIWPDKMN